MVHSMHVTCVLCHTRVTRMYCLSCGWFVRYQGSYIDGFTFFMFIPESDLILHGANTFNYIAITLVIMLQYKSPIT